MSAKLPTGTVTFLFTDLEDSTRLWAEHPEPMRNALARHDAILRESVEARGGHVVKSTGDGIYAAFAATLDAVLAASEAQRELSSEAWEATGPLRVRMGIHTGTADERDGDYFGTALNRASRLMSAAHGGQIVISQMSAQFVREALPDDLELRDLGMHQLRGLTRPERVYEVAIAGLRSQFLPLRSLDAVLGTVALPEPSFARGDGEIAGRDAELKTLENAWTEARAGVRQVALLSGEPGIGKTRLAAELSRRVQTQAGVALYGRCDEDTIVPYQPFMEALRPYVDAAPVSVLRERLRGLEYDLARIFPDLLGRIPETPQPVASDPETERYRLFEAITAVFTGISAARPTVLVLDDLQWADKPTLQLFRHLVRGAPHAALLILACYLDVELERDHPLRDLLADLRREPSVTWVALAGLSEADSGELLRRLVGRDMPRSLVAELHRETVGNPFFLGELMRHLVETGVPLFEVDAIPEFGLEGLDLPEGLREVVARRLRRLPTAVNDVLGLAAVVGPQFDAVLVAHAGQQPTETVLDALDLATRAGLVHEQPGHLGQYGFSHVLIRQILYAGLGTALRAQLHARIGTAMEEARSRHSAAERAQHFTKALPLVEASKALDYTAQAGHDALEEVAFEDAASHFERALQLLGEYEPADTARRVDLMTDLASARVYVDERAGVEAARLAVTAARAYGSPAQFARAVAVFVEPVYGAAAYPDEVTSLFDEARSALGESEPAIRARLLAFEAFKYGAYQLHGRDGRALAEASVGLARDVDDPLTLTDGLFALAVNLEGSADFTARVALGDELVALGQRAGGRARAFGLRVLARAHLERGDPEALSSTIAELGRVGDELRWLPARVYAAHWRATQALLEGRFDDVRALGNELSKHARAYHGAALMHTHQAFYLAREQGELAHMSPPRNIPVDQLRSLYSSASLALAQLESGDETAALGTVDRLAADDFHRSEWESAQGGALGMLTEVVASGGSQAQVVALYDRLSPFAGQLLAVVLGLACLGAADRYLGMLSTILGRWDEAEAHFEQALALEEQMRGRALVPRTRYWQARFLLARGRSGDDGAARSLLTSVAEDTTRLGMRRLRAQAEELGA